MRSLLKYPGGKWPYAKWITDHFPKHGFYLEPFFGGGAVFFNKHPSPYETINDIDGRVVNFFKVCRDNPLELSKLVYFTPFSRDEFRGIQEEHAGEDIQTTGEPIEDARRFLVRCNQGMGSKLADRVGWKNTKHSSGPSNPNVWRNVPDTILQVAERLKDAQIENADAVQLIKDCNAADCLIYADPPYLKSVRGRRMYRHEMMDDKGHVELLNALLAHNGPVVLSGYDNDLYNEMLTGWPKLKKTGDLTRPRKLQR